MVVAVAFLLHQGALSALVLPPPPPAAVDPTAAGPFNARHVKDIPIAPLLFCCCTSGRVGNVAGKLHKATEQRETRDNRARERGTMFLGAPLELKHSAFKRVGSRSGA